MKLRPAPEHTAYGSMIFPTFEMGVECLREIAALRCAPVSIRLVDNMQFQFGQVLKPATTDWKHQLMDKLKKWSLLCFALLWLRLLLLIAAAKCVWLQASAGSLVVVVRCGVGM